MKCICFAQNTRPPESPASVNLVSTELPSTPTTNSGNAASVTCTPKSTKVSVLSSAENLPKFFSAHPKTQRFFASNASVVDPISKRQAAVVVATAKLKEECGQYPSTDEKRKLADLLGSVLSLPPTVFFDPQSYHGYISTQIYNRHRSLQNSDKKYSWSASHKKLKLDSPSADSQPGSSTSTSTIQQGMNLP